MFLNYFDIKYAEENTMHIAQQKIGPWVNKFPEMINLLLKLNYFFLTTYKENSESKKLFFLIAHSHYIEAPYSLYVTNNLMLQGHYLNATVQLRTLLDFFVTCKYLHNNIDHVIPYSLGQKVEIDGRKKFLSISDMFETLDLKQFYNKYYGDILSKIAHGKPGAALHYRHKSGKIIMCPEFNLKNSFLILNILIPLIHGYLIHREVFFKGNLKILPTEITEECKTTLEWIKNYQNTLLKKNPDMQNWIKEVNKLSAINI